MMPTFPLGTVTSLPPRHIAYRDRVAAAQARAASQPDTQPAKTSAQYAPDPMTVRGIPAIGRNCPGHIRGTQPEHAATR